MWKPGLLALVVTGVAVAAYLMNFSGAGISSDPANWAHFGSYLAGTAGVGLVASTLWALIITLRQQQHLLDQQQKSIELQERMLQVQKEEMELTRKELASTSESNRKMVAYQSLDRLLPIFINNFDKDLKECLSLPIEGVIPSTVQALILSFGRNRDMERIRSLIGIPEFRSLFYNCFLSMRVFVIYCVQMIEQDGDLISYFQNVVDPFRAEMLVLLAFHHPELKSDFEVIYSFLSFNGLDEWQRGAFLFVYQARLADIGGWQQLHGFYVDQYYKPINESSVFDRVSSLSKSK